MINIEDILTRLKKHYKIPNNSILAKKINIDKSTISTWLSRNTIPYKTLTQISLNENISLDWLIFGEGEKFKKDNKSQNSLQNEILKEDIENIIKLLEYAPKKYLDKIKIQLEKMKDVVEEG